MMLVNIADISNILVSFIASQTRLGTSGIGLISIFPPSMTRSDLVMQTLVAVHRYINECV